MSFLSKLMFWKKDETGLGDPSFGTEPGKDTPFDDPNAPGAQNLPSFEQSMNKFQAEPQIEERYGQRGNVNMPSSEPSHLDQDIRLLSSKMDTLIAKMDNMNQRIANLERIAYEGRR